MEIQKVTMDEAALSLHHFQESNNRKFWTISSTFAEALLLLTKYNNIKISTLYFCVAKSLTLSLNALAKFDYFHLKEPLLIYPIKQSQPYYLLFQNGMLQECQT